MEFTLPPACPPLRLSQEGQCQVDDAERRLDRPLAGFSPAARQARRSSRHQTIVAAPACVAPDGRTSSRSSVESAAPERRVPEFGCSSFQQRRCSQRLGSGPALVLASARPLIGENRDTLLLSSCMSQWVFVATRSDWIAGAANTTHQSCVAPADQSERAGRRSGA
jgi:hypothetical protein